MNDVQDVKDGVIPMQLPVARPPLSRGTSSRKSIRGVAVAPHVGTIRVSPRRGSSVLRNIRGHVLPLKNIITIESEVLENEPDCTNVLPQNNEKSMDSHPIFPNFVRQSSSNVRTNSTVVPKLSGSIKISPEKETPVRNVVEEDKKLSETRKSFVISKTQQTQRECNYISVTMSFIRFSLSPAYDFWERLQVSHCGQFSVERMLALEEYCQRVSILRVIFVCGFFPFGPLLVIILTECMPLQAVDKGVLANYVFWIRHTLMGGILVFCGMTQARVWIPDIVLSIKQIIIVAIGSSAVYTTLNMVVAELWVFPIPFLVVTGAPFMLSIWVIMSRLVLGPHPLKGVQDGVFLGRQFLLLTAVQVSLLGIYPAYQALFLEVDGVLKLAMIALLPAINLSLKNVQTALGSHLVDNLPEVIIFSIDMFNAIYSVLCMHSANSIKMVAVTLILHTVVMLLSLHGMNRRSKVARACRSFQIMERQQKLIRRSQSVVDSVISGGYSSALLSSLVATTLRMLQAPGQLDATELRTIRLLSGLPHHLSEQNKKLLNSLAARSVYNNSRRASNADSMGQIKSRYSSAAMEGRRLSEGHFPPPSPPKSMLAKRLRRAVLHLVVPTNVESSTTDLDTPKLQTPVDSLQKAQLTDSGLIIEPKISSRRQSQVIVPALWQEASDKLIRLFSKDKPVLSEVLMETRKQNTRAVKQTLQLLFNNEYIGLIAYVQCIIPGIYLMYMPVLQILPNHAYYPTHYRYFGKANEFNERMTVIGTLTLLQLFLFIGLQIFVAKRFGVSTIHQVAFVLETHFWLLQGRLLLWLIFAVQSTLEHYGVDFSFQFAWLH